MRGILRSPVNSPHNGQWHGALMFSLICAWINGWVNNRATGDLRCHHTHYDVIVMIIYDMMLNRAWWWGSLKLCQSWTHKRHPIPDSKAHGANMGPTWVLSAPDGPQVGPMNLAIEDGLPYWASYGMSSVSIWEKIHPVIMYGTWLYWDVIVECYDGWCTRSVIIDDHS